MSFRFAFMIAAIKLLYSIQTIYVYTLTKNLSWHSLKKNPENTLEFSNFVKYINICISASRNPEKNREKIIVRKTDESNVKRK